MGGRILKDSGFRGTYYAAMGLMNTSSRLGDQFRREALKRCCVMVMNWPAIPLATFHAAPSHAQDSAVKWETGRRAIEELTGRVGPETLHIPFGEVTLSVRKRSVGCNQFAGHLGWCQRN